MRAMKKTGMQFSEVLDAVDALQLGEQQELIEIVRRRQAERERKRIVAQVKRSRREFAAGKYKEGTPEEIVREIAS
jgi:hypothetical protein